jgi:integrase/recombinase XerD
MALYGVAHAVPTGSMENFEPGQAVAGVIVPAPQVIRLAVAAYLARFKGQSRIHTESDLRGFLDWCQERGLDPLTVTRP